MKFSSTIIALAAFISVAAAHPLSSTTIEPVRPNVIFDNIDQTLNNVACSDGPNGLLTRGFTTFGSLPTFPNIGAGFTVHNSNSPECGSCWKLTNPDTGVTIFAIAIDTVFSGFDLSEGAVGTLIGGKAGPDFSFVNVEATEVEPSHCGL